MNHTYATTRKVRNSNLNTAAKGLSQPKGSHPNRRYHHVPRLWRYRDKRNGQPIGEIDARKMTRRYGAGARAIIEPMDNVQRRA